MNILTILIVFAVLVFVSATWGGAVGFVFTLGAMFGIIVKGVSK